jgi:RHS repeat-associated protein
MSARSFSFDKGYRYGFNGKEKDDEIKGKGDNYDYGMRMYDSRLGKFLSVDPLAKDYPWFTPFQFAGDRPIACIDVDGLEDNSYIILLDQNGKTKLVLPTEYQVGSNAVSTLFLEAAGAHGPLGGGFDQFIFIDAKGKITKVYQVGGQLTNSLVEAQAKGAAIQANHAAAVSTGLVVESEIGGFDGSVPSSLSEGGSEEDVTESTQLEEASTVSQLAKNKAQGKNFEKVVNSEMSKTQDDVVPEITVKTKSGVKTRIDLVGKDKQTGTIKLTEAKSSATAPLTKNQKVAFPEIKQSGATVVGKGKPPYVGGTKIPPTTVEIIRPKR